MGLVSIHEFFVLRSASYKLRNTVSLLRFRSVTYLKVSSFAAFRQLLVLLASLNP